MKLLILLLVAGCANESLLDKARACGSGPECNEVWEAYNRAEERKKERGKECPGDMILYTDNHGSKCVHRAEIKRLLDSLQY